MDLTWLFRAGASGVALVAGSMAAAQTVEGAGDAAAGDQSVNAPQPVPGDTTPLSGDQDAAVPRGLSSSSRQIFDASMITTGASDCLNCDTSERWLAPS